MFPWRLSRSYVGVVQVPPVPVGPSGPFPIPPNHKYILHELRMDATIKLQFSDFFYSALKSMSQRQTRGVAVGEICSHGGMLVPVCHVSRATDVPTCVSGPFSGPNESIPRSLSDGL